MTELPSDVPAGGSQWSTDFAAYFWPGTGVLRNLYGIRDEAELRRMEYRATAGREVELRMNPKLIPRTSDMLELRRIHAHLFGDIYDWAGRYRTCGISKDGNKFLAPDRFDAVLPTIDERLGDSEWRNLDFRDFVDRTAHCFLVLNWAHVFREGNGRATRLFMQRQVEDSPFKLDYSRVKPQQWHSGFHFSFPARDEYPVETTYLTSLFNQIAVPRSPDPTRALNPTIPHDLEAILAQTRAKFGLNISAAVEAAGLGAIDPTQTLDLDADTETADDLGSGVQHSPAAELDL